jgi:DNA-binding PadR family transcriptional regulator
MPLPRLTHLQFLVLTELSDATGRGRDLRERLHAAGVRQSGPAFYQMMSLLEDAGFVRGWYEQQVVAGQIIRERHYKVEAGGKKALQDSRKFYMQPSGKRRPGFAHGT